MKRLIAAIAALALGTSMISMPVSAAGIRLTDDVIDLKTDEEYPTSGFCGAEGNEENVTWSFDETTGTLTISGTGDMKDWYIHDNDYAPWYGYNIIEVVIEKGITTIGEFAFQSCKNLMSISINADITSIGYGAFIDCVNLKNIKIPDSVTNIGPCVFSGCSGISSITIPERVTNIGGEAFHGCTSLVSVNMPDSLETIGDYAFFYCNNLTSIVIPKGVTRLGESAFSNCSSLTSITISDTVKSLGCWAFANTGISSIVIPDNVENIDLWAFSDCKKLTSVIIENPTCKIYDELATFSNGRDENNAEYFSGTIYGYKGSTAQAYANKYGYKFDDINNAPVNSGSGLGDIDGSGSIDSSDASIVLQEYALLATGQKGKLNASQTKAADVNADRSVDSSDASTILRYYAYTATGGKDPFDVFLKS